MSKFEKLFWIWICIFCVIFFLLLYLSKQHNTHKIKIKRPIISQYIYKIEESDKIKRNLVKANDYINKIFTQDTSEINSTIDKHIDELFHDIDKKIDNFLDFHYSISGEYIELSSMAFSNLEKLLLDKLLGSNFMEKLKGKSQIFNEIFENKKEDFKNKILKIALHDIDLNLNQENLKILNLDIKRNIISNNFKISTILFVKFGGKFLKLITMKVSSKIASKSVLKAGMKTSTKIASAESGAVMGTLCGPFVWICSPVAATVAWFGTDAIVIKSDELLHRKELKREIRNILNLSQKQMKNNFKRIYNKKFIEFYNSLQDKLKNTTIKEEKRVRVRDEIKLIK